MNCTAMTMRERGDLCALIRRQERVAKAAADTRSIELLADAEAQIARIYRFDEDAVWADAHAAAKEAAVEAQKIIARRCDELGIPHEFRPGVDFCWFGRGRNASKERRADLRRMASARIDVMRSQARLAIEQRSVELQTQVVARGLISDESRDFLQQLPSVALLMPPVDARALIATEGDSR